MCTPKSRKITGSTVEKGTQVRGILSHSANRPLPNPKPGRFRSNFFLQIIFRRQHPTSRFALRWGSEENFFFAFPSRFASAQRVLYPEREPVSATLQFLTRIPFSPPKNHFRRQNLYPENQQQALQLKLRIRKRFQLPTQISVGSVLGTPGLRECTSIFKWDIQT